MSNFKFNIEDVFTISGRGTVVTGRLEYGVIHLNEEIEIHNPDMKFVTKTVVGGIEQFRKTCNTAEAGGNYGILLRGVSRHEVSRGSFLTAIGGQSEALEWDFSGDESKNNTIMNGHQNIAASTLNGGVDETNNKWWKKLF